MHVVSTKQEPDLGVKLAGVPAGRMRGVMRRLRKRGGLAKAFGTAETRLRHRIRMLSGTVGPLPDFLIIGAQRGGTTSLFRYLTAHPEVPEPLTKEIHYFTDNFHQGVEWYRAHFSAGARIGEATPYYLFHPEVPKRVAKLLPEARLVVLLRNPIDRAYSQYQHERRAGWEDAPSFEAALNAEPRRLADSRLPYAQWGRATRFAHKHHSYLARGEYAPQLRRWFDAVGRDRVLVLRSEAMFETPSEVYAQVRDFLGLADFEPTFEVMNAIPSRDMSPETRQRLVEHFAAPNDDLYRLLGWDAVWDEP